MKLLEEKNKEFANKLIVASSLGVEDQVITDMFVKINPQVRIFVLDTGRFHQETYDVMDKTMKKYGIKYEVYTPNQKNLQDLVSQKGSNSFYESVENRKECCYIRKVEPLNRALSTADAWVTGLRRSQGVTRTELAAVERDESHNMEKINPLFDWSENDVWDYVKKHDVPVNALHSQGFPSIGCAPCTRAIKPGEDTRAGRWWWEAESNKECGLHVVDGKLVRMNNEPT